MPIIKLPSKSYQAKLRGKDGRTTSTTFFTRAEAEEQLAKWKQEKREGTFSNRRSRQVTVEQFFNVWFTAAQAGKAKGTDSGWLTIRQQQYRDFVRPVIGTTRLREITPAHIQRVLIRVAKEGRSTQLQLHVFNLLRKLFRDAIEDHRLLTFNPATLKLKPVVSEQEAPHLTVAQTEKLLAHVSGKRYGLAITTQFYLGLRSGELQALTWNDIDLENGWAIVRRTYIRKTRAIRNYPKGRKQHRKPIPAGILPQLLGAKEKSTCEFVASEDGKSMLSYEWYHRTLKRYCAEIGLPVIGTHGLRHSTSEFYQSHGATKDDLQELFAHSSQEVTRRYIHGSNSNLRNVANRARLKLVVGGSAVGPEVDDEGSTKGVHENEKANQSGNSDSL